jgi:hypothetical protein
MRQVRNDAFLVSRSVNPRPARFFSSAEKAKSCGLEKQRERVESMSLLHAVVVNKQGLIRENCAKETLALRKHAWTALISPNHYYII